MENQNFYVVFGNNEHTQRLVRLLQKRDDGVINVVDEYQEHSLIVRNDVAYIQEHHLKTLETLDFNFWFYHYLDPAKRTKRQG